MNRVFVLGNATLDVTQRVAHLPRPGETLIGSPPTRNAGGKGLNQAIVAARAGAPTFFAATIGDDADGAMLRAALAAEPIAGVNLIAGTAPSDLSVIWVDAQGQNVIVSSNAAALSIPPQHATEFLDEMTASDWLLLQGNLSQATTHAAAAQARRRGARIAVNPAPINFQFEDTLALADLIVVNEVEAMTLAPQDDAKQAAAALATPSRAVVLTLGADGAWLHGASSARHFAAPRVKAVDTAGAGDVLTGTLVGLLAQGQTPLAALNIAIAAASLSVTRPGTLPSFPTQAEFAALQRR